MNNERRQAQLLEQFMARLRQNIHAEPPSALDPEMVEIARKLAKQSYLQGRSLNTSTQARIWQKALQDSQVVHLENDEENSEMFFTPALPKQKQFPLTLIAVAVAIVLFGVIAFVISNGQLPDDNNSIIMGANQGDTTPTVIFEPTIIPNGPTIPEGYVPIVMSLIELDAGTQLTEGMLTIAYWNPSSAPSTGLIGQDGLLSAVGQYINRDLSAYSAMLTDYLTEAIPIPTITASATWTHTPTPNPTDSFALVTATAILPDATQGANNGQITSTPFPQDSGFLTATAIVTQATQGTSGQIMPTVTRTFIPTSTPLAYEEVVVTLIDIPFGTQITEDMITLIFIEAGSVPDRALIGNDGIAQIVDHYAIQDLPPAMMIREETLPLYIGDSDALASAIDNLDVDDLRATADANALQATQEAQGTPIATSTPAPISLMPIGDSVPTGFAEIVVSTVDIPSGTRITSNMLTLVQWDVNVAPFGALAGDIGRALFDGRYANRDIPAFTAMLTVFADEASPLEITATAVAIEASTTSGIQIVNVTGAGDLQSEEAVIRNFGETVNLSGWSLSDSDGNVFTFPEDRRVFSDAPLSIISRDGQDSPVIIHWGLDSAIYESGETLILRDDAGDVISTYQIP